MIMNVALFAQNSSSTIEILPQSELTITGDTNINKFECNFDASCLEGNRKISFETQGSRISFKNAVLVLQNENFDCGNRPINKDFHSLLQTEIYPEILLELKQVFLKNKKTGTADVTISIAGIKKDYQLPVEIVKGKNLHFKGKLHLNINDFNLKPPKKLFGAIVVNEDIDINFNLTVKN